MDKTIVAITGASSGIGEAFARKLAPGHDLILIARRRDRLQKLADQLGEYHGTNSEVLEADLANEHSLNQVAERIANEKRLALLVNNAGFGTQGRFWEIDLGSQEKMHRLHVMATVKLSHAALRNMVPRDFGAIVNVASVSSFVRSPGMTSYSATKAWMTAFTEGLYLELQESRSSVIVQALCPGYTYTEFGDAMGVKRTKVAYPSFWLTSEQVVDASVEGLRRRKLLVIPGWRYQILTALVRRLPSAAKLALEGSASRFRDRPTPVLPDSDKQIGSSE